ncbi:peptidoglycan-binding protein [Pedococcus bigeumensis]|uniref:peptidoglycan-binding protein n=1 Tax=Pedococcus bigeumensis TaxID=433644 RepID=UPI002FEAE71B
MTDSSMPPLTADELAAEGGTALPDKEVISLLDLNADLDIGLDAAAPIDLAVAANANVAAPIDAAVGANILSAGSEAQAMADQGVLIDQGITGEAVADAGQDSTIDQAAEAPATDVPTDATTAPTDGATTPTDATRAATSAGALDGNLLNVDVDLAADLDLAAPIAGAVAANANVAAPIDAAVAANIGSIDSDAVALAQQDAIIVQDIDADADATTDQSSDISQ